MYYYIIFIFYIENKIKKQQKQKNTIKKFFIKNKILQTAKFYILRQKTNTPQFHMK